MSATSNWPLLVIIVGLAGAGVSYHFTLDSRFAAIEQKLDQNALAMQQAQIAQETMLSSKTEALNRIGKEVDALQASTAPLGKATQDQTDALSEIRKQVSSLQQTAQTQQDAQKKYAEYSAQLEKIRHDVQTATQPAATLAPAAPTPAATPAAAPKPTANASPTSPAVGDTASNPVPPAHASAVPIPLPPHADSSVDLRPAEITSNEAHGTTRAMPVALPVNMSVSTR